MPDPTTDDSGRRILPLQRQLRGYKNSDPITKRQCCLPLSIFYKMEEEANSQTEIAISQLARGALLFAMRSCEYSQVGNNPSDNNRKTKLLRVRNIRFFQDTREIHRDIPNLPSIANTVRITFESQKNGEKFESIAMRRTGGSLCPVNTWATIVKRITSYPRGSEDSPVNLVRINRRYTNITSAQIRYTLRKTITLLGEDDIGVKSSQVGTHSIRSTFAMILFTHGVERTTIMRLGRWKSDAVLCYIRSQVSGFGKNASTAFKTDPGSDFANFPLPRNLRDTTTPTTPTIHIHNITSQPVPMASRPRTAHHSRHRTSRHTYKLRSSNRKR